jgi:hypothetical protein
MGLEAPAGERLGESYQRITGRVRELYESVLERLAAG